jgi:hypothetical protein
MWVRRQIINSRTRVYMHCPAVNEYAELARNWNFFSHGALPLFLKSRSVVSQQRSRTCS